MNRISIQNFKAFSEEQTIDTSKNLLLYGENGAGKSSIYEAFKLIFFRSRVAQQIPRATTPEQEIQNKQDFWSTYNNKVSNLNFTIKVDGTNHTEFPTQNYQAFMITLEDLVTMDKFYLDKLLKKCYLDITDVQDFCSNHYREIQDAVNQALHDFNESIQIEIDTEDSFSIKITDSVKQLENKSELKKYFNEAKLNLTVLLLLFNSIKIAQKNDETITKFLILDDFITSLDMSNRTFLMKYILDNFSNFQLFIFTHNIHFYNLILYLVNNIDKSTDKWNFGNLYEINSVSKLYFKNPMVQVSEIREEFEKDPTKIEEVGNKIRQKFEVLLYEYSKLFMVGAVEV